MIIPIQYLRGIAALMVVYHHIAFQLSKAGSSLALPFSATGAAGVDIFFVISGFIMWVTTRSPGLTSAQFLQRRLIRILPLYWAVTALLLAVAFLFPQLLATTRLDPHHALLSLFFIPVRHPVLEGEIAPFFIQGWTLNYEMFFYIVFALAMTVKRSAMFGMIAAVLCALALAGLLAAPENAALKFYATTLMLEFIGGMAVGWLFLRYPGTRPTLAWLMIAAGVGGLAAADWMGYGFGPNGARPERAFVWGLPGVVIVAGCVFLARMRKAAGAGPLWMLGESSYSLYLTHLLTLPALAILWRMTGLGFGGAGASGYAATAIVLSSIAAWISFVAFERPVTTWLRVRTSPWFERPRTQSPAYESARHAQGNRVNAKQP